MKIMKYGLITFFILSFILFALPFVLKGILNIGNITGMLGSFLCVLVVLNSKQLYPYLTSKITIIFVILFLGIITFCSYKILSNINHPSNKETTVVVLGCRVKDKKPSLALKERLDKTYEYLNENKELNCVLSGGQGDDEEISEAKCMYQYLVKKGIDKKRLYLEDQSTSTRENILFSYKIIEKENLNKTITIITNEFHEYRAQTIASNLNIESYAVSTKTAWWLFPTYFVREIFGMIYEFIFYEAFMGGISVLIILGLFMSFYAFYLFVIFISVFYLFENYLFECVYLYKKEHSLIAWLPYYNKYLIGKQVNKEKEGIFLMVIEILGTICFYLSLNVQLGSFDTIIFILFIVCCLISFSMNIYLLHKIMKQAVLKYADWITIFNVLTLGFFRGISLFLIRNKS